MIQELLLASQSVQALGTLLKTAHGLANYNEIVAAVSEVNSKLMQANGVALASQEKQSELSKHILELEHEIRELRSWDNELKRYQLKKYPPGIYVYELTPGMENSEPPHMLCANCFSKRQKSLLQVIDDDQYNRDCKCHNCSSRYRIELSKFTPPPNQDYDPSNGPDGWMSR
jgi:hypothetical protein